VADGFDAVAVRVSYETAEVVGVVFGEDPWRVEDLGTDPQSGGMDTVDGGPVGSGECDVQLSGSAAVGSRPDPKWCTFTVGKADRLAVGVGSLESERREDRLVEGLTSGHIGDLQ